MILTAGSMLYAGTVERSGDLLALLLPAAAAGSTAVLEDRTGGWQFARGFAANAAVTLGLKYTVAETRPNEEDDHSFPSGHTSLAFQSAAFIHKRYGLNYALPAYLAAVYVGYSRVESDNHYIHDVVAGALIGTVSTLCFTTKYKGWKMSPVARGKRIGVELSFKF
ncbi:phosphoesterase [Hydrogenimonas cancrithermarum]|uniref:Phosphoesterase n=2 Tax=Hydrogenimonas cancrithermarum TaxID=2993563 RepID=A0ABN6WW85_9BACT|nr:phosphoesterase [Hydrogenimonas cancrithermarum]